jgi:peptidyl-dipeptidase Dcp
MTGVNPFARESALPYRLPPFSAIRTAHFIPAFTEAMAEQRREIDAITASKAPPTFANTILALEQSGQMLNRVAAAFFNLNSSNTDAEIQKIEGEISPRLAAHRDAINMDPALFARVDALYRARSTLGLDPVSMTLLERHHTELLRAGSQLSESDKHKLKQLNEELSALTTQFKQNVMKATKDGALVVADVDELEGMSAEEIGAAQEAAKARSLDGCWLLTLRNTTTQPALAQLKRRAVRERLYRASVNRAIGGDADNLSLVARIVKLRAAHAALLGFENHAAYVLADETAGTPAAVNEILAQLAPAAVANARREAADIQQLIDSQAAATGTPSFQLEPWDWAFFAEQVRKARYDFDEAEVRPYFELDNVLRDGLFYAAAQLFGLRFEERRDLPAYRSDVRVFEVFDADGGAIGLFLADYFARDNKQGGAWMSSFVEQSWLLGHKPVVVNNVNIPKPADGQPVLLTFEEVTAMFHEFGHALHGLLSDVRYPLLAGTNVPRDFVEYPSQYNEMWAREPEVFANYARHYQTGQPMPRALLDKVLAAHRFGQGYATTEYLAAAVLDQSWHQIAEHEAPTADHVLAFEAAALAKHGVDLPAVPPRYRTTFFMHVFAGGYAAGYYAYLWSEILARNTEHWFRARGGLQRANGDELRARVLSRGRSEDPKGQFEKLHGRPAEIGPLLEHRGLTLAMQRR